MGYLWEYLYFRIMEISTLSDVEYVQIVANYNNIDQDDEEQILRDRGYDDAQIKIALGDKKYTSFKSLDVVFHEKSTYKYPRFSMVISAFMAYKKGMLPYNGSYLEQPAKIIDIFNVLNQLELEAQEKAQKAAQKKAKRG